jgi:hypothetical protein
MKRCPQCEFIYEDDQSLCDMDGILLVFDSQQLPKPMVSAALPSSTQWRNRIVPVFAAMVLAAVLGLVYYVSTNKQRAYQPTPVTAGQPSLKASDATAGSESTKTPGETPSETNATVNEKEASSRETSSKSERKEPADKPKSTVSPAAAKSEAEKKTKAKPRSTEKAQSSTKTKKDDSKIGSLIKKTGSLLKKPFKF